MKKIFPLFLLLLSVVAWAQPKVYSAGNLHSHNDYEKPFPFWEAYNKGYGSIEADIFLRAGQLIIAHDTAQIKRGRTLDSLYLTPLQECIKKNNGFPYPAKDKILQLLIDIKTDSVATLSRLVEKLKLYPDITGCKAVRVVISGSRPAAEAFPVYPEWIYFDGELNLDYPAAALQKIEMLSDNFKSYSLWNGNDTLLPKERIIIEALIAKGHSLHKKVRFWNAPDTINSWKIFESLGVDYINTDHITAAAGFINK